MLNFGHPKFKKKKYDPKCRILATQNFKRKNMAQNAEFWPPKI